MNEITMEVRRCIKVGTRYCISPTLTFLGVLPGTVEVLEIGKKEDIQDPDAQVSIRCYIDAYCEEDIEEYFKEDIEGLWVSYRYTDGQSDGVDAFPISEFLRHTSDYI